jgi:nitrous oxidase accessory protein
VIAPAALFLVALAGSTGEMAPIAPGELEGRPPAADASPLQALLDEAAPGAEVILPAGVWRGDLIVDRPMTLRGGGRVRLVGSGHGSVVRVRAEGVTLEGLAIDGAAGGDLGRDSSGIHVSGHGATVRRCRVENALFGVYLHAADGARVEETVIRGIPGKAPGEKGSGIHAWNTQRFTFVGNDVRDARDGFYIQSSSNGVIRGNRAADLRYGLHYMYSDDNLFEDNVFERTDAGTVLMYSRRIVFRRNRFLHNRGFASVGLLLKACDDTTAEDNLIADNARGIFLEGSYRNVFRRNVVAESDAAIVLYDSCSGTVFEDNAFVGNLSPLMLVGRRTDARFHGNFWSDDDTPDLDGDGRRDRPYVLGSLFDHLRGNLIAADLLAQSPAAAALALAERAFPVLEPVKAADDAPLSRMPALGAVPRPDRPARSAGVGGVAASVAGLLAGLAVLAGGRRRRPEGTG